jgi:hypothetical protein
MRHCAAVLVLALSPAPCLAVGRDALAGGMGFHNPDVTPGQRLGLALAALLLVGGLADALRTPGDWLKPLALAVFVAAFPVATVLGERLINPDPQWEDFSGWGDLAHSGVFVGWAAVVFLVGFFPEWVRSARQRGPAAVGRRAAVSAACGLAAGVVGNAVVPTHAGGILHGLVWAGLLAGVGAAGLLVAAARLAARSYRGARRARGSPTVAQAERREGP